MLRACSSAISMSAARCCKRLEAADRHAELPPRLEILDRHVGERRHRAHRFGGERRDRLVGDALDQRQRRARLAQHVCRGPTATEPSVISAARIPSCVG